MPEAGPIDRAIELGVVRDKDAVRVERGRDDLRRHRIGGGLPPDGTEPVLHGPVVDCVADERVFGVLVIGGFVRPLKRKSTVPRVQRRGTRR